MGAEKVSVKNENICDESSSLGCGFCGYQSLMASWSYSKVLEFEVENNNIRGRLDNWLKLSAGRLGVLEGLGGLGVAVEPRRFLPRRPLPQVLFKRNMEKRFFLWGKFDEKDEQWCECECCVARKIIKIADADDDLIGRYIYGWKVGGLSNNGNRRILFIWIVLLISNQLGKFLAWTTIKNLKWQDVWRDPPKQLKYEWIQ